MSLAIKFHFRHYILIKFVFVFNYDTTELYLLEIIKCFNYLV